MSISWDADRLDGRTGPVRHIDPKTGQVFKITPFGDLRNWVKCALCPAMVAVDEGIRREIAKGKPAYCVGCRPGAYTAKQKAEAARTGRRPSRPILAKRGEA